MPDRVEVFNITCPASTTIAAPQESVLTNVVNVALVRFTLRIPAGHAGLTGIALGYGHQPVLPRSAGAFISGDDEVIIYDLSDYPIGPQWQAFTINSDLQAHTWQLRFELNENRGQADSLSPTPLPIADIVAAGTAHIGVA